MKLGKRQLETLQIIGPSQFLVVGTKEHQRHCDRLVDLGLASYPPPSASSGKRTMGDGDLLVITSKGVAALEAAGLWPHGHSDRVEAADA